MRPIIFRIALAAAAMTLALPAISAEKLPVGGHEEIRNDMESQVTFRNDSSWKINELYFSRSASHDWGKDQLGRKTIRNGDTFTLTDIQCGTYDVKLIDEDGDQCDIEHVQLCDEAHTWSIRDKDLARCQAKTSQR
jgi:hypothetical protein